ncbi:MAG: long-chain fatty acid--CoA ligase [Chitinophagaceae bacterium]|nr:long-chain fatty acid--CoA ligase [Chitinophagaceae bacterium]
MSSNIDFLIDNFQVYNKDCALIWKGEFITYEHLLRRVEAWNDRLKELEAGSIVGLEGDFSPESIALLLSLIGKKAIVVPLDINNADRNKEKYQIAQLDLLIRITDDNDISFHKVAKDLSPNELYDVIRKSGSPGLVLFTSGSSGKPKAALHNFSKLLDKFRTRRKALKTINFLLFDHWGGLNTLFHILSNGGTVVILENRNPDYVCSLIEKYQVELLPTSPTFLNMLLFSRAYERYSLDSLKLITYGAEPMPESLLKSLNQIFPAIEFQQTYGLIELGVMRSKSEVKDSLWVKIGGEGFEVRVVDNMLQIKSDSAMLGYLNAPSPFTADGWFQTGDAVEVKGDYFRILGRKSELINVGGEKVFPQEIENTILEIPGVEDVLVYGESHPMTGSIVCAKIKYSGVEDKKKLINVIKTHCRSKLESFKIPIKIQVVDDSFESARFKKTRING